LAEQLGFQRDGDFGLGHRFLRAKCGMTMRHTGYGVKGLEPNDPRLQRRRAALEPEG
jgi:hypothetical protein